MCRVQLLDVGMVHKVADSERFGNILSFVNNLKLMNIIPVIRMRLLCKGSSSNPASTSCCANSKNTLLLTTVEDAGYRRWR